MKYEDVLLIMDLDGTLLTGIGDGAYVSDEDQRLLTTFIQQGGTFSVATARNKANTLRPLADLNVNFPMTLINGGLVIDHHTHEKLMVESIDPTFLKGLYTLYQQQPKCGLLVVDETRVVRVKDDRDFNSDFGFEWGIIEFDELTDMNVLKAALVFEPEVTNAVEENIERLPQQHDIDVQKVLPHIIEFSVKGVSKASAIKALMEHHGGHDKTLVCVGDQMNDEAMLELADIALVPAGGNEKLRAKHHTLTQDHGDGMVKEILSLIKQA